MSETTTTPTPTKTISKWEFAGYWTALIGGFVLVVQGILMFFAYLADGLKYIGGMSFFTFAETFWLNGLLSLLLGILVLFLIWEWLQQQVKTGPWIKNHMWLGVIFLVIGLITGGSGGVLVLVGGIYYLLSVKK